MSVEAVPVSPPHPAPVPKLVRVITEDGWPVVFWDGVQRHLILGLRRSWQGQHSPVGDGGWCVYFLVQLRAGQSVLLLLAVQQGDWYLEELDP